MQFSLNRNELPPLSWCSSSIAPVLLLYAAALEALLSCRSVSYSDLVVGLYHIVKASRPYQEMQVK